MGVLKITGYDELGNTIYSHTQENKWTTAILDKIFACIQDPPDGAIWPISLYLSSYPTEVAYTQTSTSLFSSEQNYSVAASSSSPGNLVGGSDKSTYSSTIMNSQTYPNVLLSYNASRSYVAGLRYQWDNEVFYVDNSCNVFTTLSVAATAGDTAITISDPNSLYKGAYVSLYDFTNSETQQIADISGNIITFTTALTYSYNKLGSVCGSSVIYHTDITTLSSAVSAGTNILSVSDTSEFDIGETISLYNSSTNLMERSVIGSIETNQFTLTGGVSVDWAQGSSILGTWREEHSSLAYTISQPLYGAYDYWYWSIDDISATNFGSSPIRTIALVNGTTIYATILLDAADAIYKDSVSNIKVLRLEYYLFLMVG